MLNRFCAIALAAAALAGCATGSGGGYGYYDDPYPDYGGGFGSYYGDHDHDRYYHPARGVSCDRARDICYDEANQAYKKYGNSVFLFSPRSGVSCDRRTKECSDGAWPDHAVRDPLKRLEKGNKGSIGAGAGFDHDDVLARPVAPARRTSDEDNVIKPIKPRVQAPLADNDIAAPLRRVQPQRPKTRPMLNSGDKPGNGGGSACPPRGCRD
jgi:hypothetical protein